MQQELTPVQEVQLYLLQREQIHIRQRIVHRKYSALKAMGHATRVPPPPAEQMHVEQSGAKDPVVDLADSSNDDEDTMEYSNEVPVAEYAQPVHTNAYGERGVPQHEHVRVVPKTV